MKYLSLLIAEENGASNFKTVTDLWPSARNRLLIQSVVEFVSAFDTAYFS